MRLIDADVLKENVPSTSADMFENCRNCRLLDEYQIREIIDNAPTVDAVPVVRCRECLYWQSGENEAEKWEYCRLHQIGIGPHSFCSYGERIRE